MEIYKDIIDYKWLYQVSNLGNVKSLKRKFAKEKILKLITHHSWYIIVCLWKNWKSKNHIVHRLVWETHIPNPHNLPFINHIDWDKSNNCTNNLEWCTQSHNEIHKFRVLKCNKPVRKIIQYSLWNTFIKEWNSLTNASKELNISIWNISYCASWKLNHAWWYIWRYKSSSDKRTNSKKKDSKSKQF